MEEGSWTGPEGIETLADEFEALLAGMWSGRAVPVEELEGYVGALQAFCARLEAVGDGTLDPAEIHENDRNMRPRHHDYATPGPHRCDAHTVQPSSINQDTGSRAAEAPPKPCCPRGDLYGHEGGGSGQGAHANSPPEMPPLVEDVTARLRLHRLTPRLPRELQQRLPAFCLRTQLAEMTGVWHSRRMRSVTPPKSRSSVIDTPYAPMTTRSDLLASSSIRPETELPDDGSRMTFAPMP